MAKVNVYNYLITYEAFIKGRLLGHSFYCYKMQDLFYEVKDIFYTTATAHGSTPV